MPGKDQIKKAPCIRSLHLKLTNHYLMAGDITGKVSIRQDENFEVDKIVRMQSRE
jgi:hypothetical protein